MKKIHLILILIILTISVFGQKTFTLFSSTLGGQFVEQQLFNGFGCSGKNESPQLSWENAPEGTKSFAVTMYDLDAPTGSGWWHWVMFDIPANTNELVTNTGNVELDLAPKGAIQSITDYSKRGYGGPCPPKGDAPHEYIITVYALKVDKLGLDKNTNPALVGFYLGNNTIEKASIVSYYQR